MNAADARLVCHSSVELGFVGAITFMFKVMAVTEAPRVQIAEARKSPAAKRAVELKLRDVTFETMFSYQGLSIHEQKSAGY